MRFMIFVIMIFPLLLLQMCSLPFIEEDWEVISVHYHVPTNAIHIVIDTYSTSSYTYYKDESMTILLDFSDIISIPGITLSAYSASPLGPELHIESVVPTITEGVNNTIYFNTSIYFYGKDIISYFHSNNKKIRFISSEKQITYIN